MKDVGFFYKLLSNAGDVVSKPLIYKDLQNQARLLLISVTKQLSSRSAGQT
jgi:hypothetical protein